MITQELSLYGVLVPPLLLSAIAASGALALMRRLLTGRGFYRFVWHPALFDLAVFVVLLGGFDAVISR